MSVEHQLGETRVFRVGGQNFTPELGGHRVTEPFTVMGLSESPVRFGLMHWVRD